MDHRPNININIKCNTIKLPQDNIRENLNDFRYGDDILL